MAEIKEGGTMWYHYKCTDSNTAKIEVIDPVTGEKGYATEMDGSSVGLDQKYCRDINDGDCDHFRPVQKKGWVWR